MGSMRYFTIITSLFKLSIFCPFCQTTTRALIWYNHPMHSDSYEDIVKYLIEKAENLLNYKRITDGIVQIDYVAIYPKDEQEKAALLDSLKTISVPIKTTPTGTVFKLGKPIQTISRKVLLLKIHTVDPLKQQRGYIDYQVEDYESFKRTNLMNNSVEITENADRMEMLTTSENEIAIYFPENPLGKDFI